MYRVSSAERISQGISPDHSYVNLAVNRPRSRRKSESKIHRRTSLGKIKASKLINECKIF